MSLPFFMVSSIFGILQSWPDQLVNVAPESHLLKSAHSIRLGNYMQAELSLLQIEADGDSSLIDAASFLRLLFFLYTVDQAGFVSQWQHVVWSDHESIYSRIAKAQYCLIIGDLSSLSDNQFNWDEPVECQFLANTRIALAFAQGNLDLASELLSCNSSSDTIERVLLRSNLYSSTGEYGQAIAALELAVRRAPASLPLRIRLVDLLFESRNQTKAIPTLASALHEFSDHPLLYSSVSLAKLHNREPALALRAKLCERLRTLNRFYCESPRDANLIAAYDHLGRCDWLSWLSDQLSDVKISQLDLHSNLLMQLSSVEDPNYMSKAQSVVSAFTSGEPFQKHLMAKPIPLELSSLPDCRGKPMKIAWLSGDIANHPVCRFLLGILSAGSLNRLHQHVVVSLQPPTSEFKSLFERLGVEFVDASVFSAESKTAAIRRLSAHVAVDLSGWTGGHHATALMARVAPVQVNYLGYHASTGIPQVDYWLGDTALFPEPMQEWHSEKIWRLPRPFIAWNPPSCLVEAGVPVTSPPDAEGIRFGCFNHFRKVSDACLSTWAKLLFALPDARLVLKGTTGFDSASSDLTRRRLIRQGLDPDRIDWLPLTPTPAEHLQQYNKMDIALDCFPNTGCTTTCEALWMGVPVITLAGSGYVSRMGTAVLNAVGLDDWIADSQQHYVEIAVSQARKLIELRSQRPSWRERVQSSSLGDAEGLFQALEQAFSDMAIELRNATAFSR